MKKQRFVLDTSAFTAPGACRKESDTHIKCMIRLISESSDCGVTCYIPPSAWAELKGMLERKGYSDSMIRKLDSWLVQKSPSRKEIMVPAEFVYEYISEVRARMNKALREAEKAVLSVGGNRPDPEVIHDLRERLKTSMRKGIVDSEEDLDILMLAKELKAGVVSKDEGVMLWAKNWGIRFIDAESFPALLREYKKKGA